MASWIYLLLNLVILCFPFGVVAKPPNIVFILTDDQDARLGSLEYMTNVQKHIVGEGLNVKNHYGTVALCCPARATLFRGQAAHNTNITHVGGPGYVWPFLLQFSVSLARISEN